MKKKIMFYAICAAFTALGGFMAYDCFEDGRYLKALWGILSVAFFGGGGLFVLYRDLRYSNGALLLETFSQQVKNRGIIRMSRRPDEDIEAVIDSFLRLYAQDNPEGMERPACTLEYDWLTLSFSDTDAAMFGCWANYLVYRSKRPDYALRGWYEADGLSPSLSTRSPLMFFIPEDDNEGDCVYFMTHERMVWKLSFTAFSFQPALRSFRETYTEAPL